MSFPARYFLPAALLLLMGSGCTRQRLGGSPTDGTGTTDDGRGTALRIEAGVRDASPRAIEQRDEAGTEGERSVHDMTVLFDHLAPRSFDRLTTKGDIISTPVFFLTEGELGGVRRISALLNGQRLGLTKTDFRKDRTVSLSDFDRLADTSDGAGRYKDFLMTAAAEADSNSVTLTPGLSAGDVTGGGTTNNLAFDVERVLSKAQVRLSNNLLLTGDLSPDRGTLELHGVALAGSAKEAYLFRDRAGERRADDATLDYSGKTYVDGMTVSDDWDPAQGHPFLQRVSDYIGKRGAEAANFAMQPFPAQKGEYAAPIYFLENSASRPGTATNTLEYNRITYLKVYGKFTPKMAWPPDEEEGVDSRKDPLKSFEVDATLLSQSVTLRFESLSGRVNEAQLKRIVEKYGNVAQEDRKDPNAIWLEEEYGDYTLVIKCTPGTFFYDPLDGKVYVPQFYDPYNEDPKVVTVTTLDQYFWDTTLGRLQRYVGGEMVWLVPVHAETAEDNSGHTYVRSANTRRNNIYDLTLTAISGMGLPYDPIDPADPNIPHAPAWPGLTPHIKVGPYTTGVRMYARTLKWNVQELHYSF